MSDRRLQRWERAVEVPLLLFAVAFFLAYAWPVVDGGLDHSARTFCSVVSWTVWIVFAVDFVVRVALAGDRRRYLLGHWYDVLLIVVPVFRPLRLLRLLAFLRVLSRSTATSLASRATVYAVGTAAVSTVVGAVAVLSAEEDDPHSNIHSLGVALWWAAETVTTVGYGDHYPVSTQGRLIAVALMIVGIGTVGVVTASFAAWLLAGARNAAERNELPSASSGAGPTAADEPDVTG